MTDTAIAYVGEHAWPGMVGHLLVVISFVAVLLSAVGYITTTRTGSDAWRSVGRLGFRVHSVAVLGIIATLFIMLFKHWFEYDYVWKHSNLAMPLRYILSCFWEGQEGSFLLWTFWHMVLGNILIVYARQWEAPVLSVFALVQVFLASMLLGVYVFGFRLGSSPFLLVRELPENLGLPWTQMADYLQRIPQFADGRGLNPLLQNYWMVIHPPTLFLGFAATLVPFAYAIAGLWKRKLSEWIAPALPWTYFGIMILGTGILMGGAWAYEALSFGGFWAWDPVENASLVPWLTLVGAGHLMLVNKRKPDSLFTTFLFALVTFHLVLYSTFLTRSGVLGDTSVHSFTGDGMMPGLTLFMLFFVWLATTMLHPNTGQRRFYSVISAVVLLIGVVFDLVVPAILAFGVISVVWTASAYSQGFHRESEDEALWSREFWMFIGALVLLVSAAQITFSTSVPVFNLLLEPFKASLASLAETMDSAWLARLAEAKMAPPSEAIAHYNRWQLPFAFLIALLVACGQYLRYKSTDMRVFLRKILGALVAAVLLTVLGVALLRYSLNEWKLIALLFATSFAATANATYIWKGLNGKWSLAGPAVAHIGFALVLLGALISTSRQQEMSRNTAGMDLRFLSEDFNNNSEVLLYRGDTVVMGEFFVHFKDKRKEGVDLRYAMDYFAQTPNTYSAGDTVRVGKMIFVARNDHQASPLFVADQPEHWDPLETATRRMVWRSPYWRSKRPGEKRFELEPFVQLNPRFGNVAEPSTKHWPHRDLYTHVRYADLAEDDASDTTGIHYMPARLYEKEIGDTIFTPTSMIILDSLRLVRDSVTLKMLGPEYVVFALQMRVRDLYDADRWFEAKPVLIYRDQQAIAGKGAEIIPLRSKFELATVDGKKIGLNVFEHEFVVMQAIVFPGINILWIGCVLMFLGTFMAVRKRFLLRSKE